MALEHASEAVEHLRVGSPIAMSGHVESFLAIRRRRENNREIEGLPSSGAFGAPASPIVGRSAPSNRRPYRREAQIAEMIVLPAAAPRAGSMAGDLGEAAFGRLELRARREASASGAVAAGEDATARVRKSRSHFLHAWERGR